MAGLDYEAITVSSTAKNLTAAVIDQQHDWGLITIEDAACRFTVDGTTATASVGHIVNPGDVIELLGMAELGSFSIIRKDGVDATIRVTTGVRNVGVP